MQFYRQNDTNMFHVDAANEVNISLPTVFSLHLYFWQEDEEGNKNMNREWFMSRKQENVGLFPMQSF